MHNILELTALKQSNMIKNNVHSIQSVTHSDRTVHLMSLFHLTISHNRTLGAENDESQVISYIIYFP